MSTRTSCSSACVADFGWSFETERSKSVRVSSSSYPEVWSIELSPMRRPGFSCSSLRRHAIPAMSSILSSRHLRAQPGVAAGRPDVMRYIIHGAGSVGAVIGARLFEQGAQVVLIARGEHLRAIQGSGLAVPSPLGSVTLQVPAVAHPSEIGFRAGEDVVLLATKTQDSAQALDDLRLVAGAAIPVVCLQNGVESARIAVRRFERVAGAITMLPSVYLRAGIVQSFSAPVAGIVDVGRYPCGESAVVAAVAADLRR